MRAIVQQSYGGPETLEVQEVPTPSPGSDQVLLRVHAAGVDRGVWHLMRGEPMLVRLGFGLRRPKVPTPGFDVAGEVVAVGSSVQEFAVGDEVFGIGVSTFAEYAVAKTAKLVLKPVGLDWDAAGAATISGITAVEALRFKGQVSQGDRVLVLGASGGVGAFGVQVAKALGAAEVVGVASAAKRDFVLSLGAGECLDYAVGSIDVVAAGHAPFDMIFDLGGNNPTRMLRSLLTDDGTLVIAGGEGGGAVTGGFGRGIRAAMLSPFVSHRMPFFLSAEKREFIEPLRDLLADGSVVVPVAGTYSLDQASAALADLERGAISGKAVLRIQA